MNPTPIASHTISLVLQYLLPPSELPTYLISRPLLQRHHFLSISSTDTAAYLCWPHPRANPEKSVAALEYLSAQDHEWLVRTAEIRYQPQASSSDAAQARVWLGDAIQLVFIWEEDQDGAGWRYFDADHRPLPSNCSPTLSPALQVTPPEQDQEQDISADDYWAGYDSGSSPRSPRIPERELGLDDEDAYWASYGAVHGSADSTIPSPAPQKKRLDAWGREELPWEEHAELDAQAWDIDETASRHGPPSSLSAPFSALSEPDDAPLDEEPKAEYSESKDNEDHVPPFVSRQPSSSSKVPSTADTGLSNAIRGMYAMWLTSRQDTGSEETRKAFMELVQGALIDG
ncbi:hypothetical protein RHS01_00863 [Rhizoctonia solani]|uniref:Uncharacterized protein n=1 Tax=Rhizoctonia solani TaxID=456999 RepID=A0A8H7M9Q6_9AGAM|nr:hypothetical protein RHS01_00863 [Rhizoctonia solani]